MSNQLEQAETPRYATVLYEVMDKLDVSIAEYVLLDMVHKLSFRTGYCYKKPSSIAADLRLTKQGTNKMIARLIHQGLLERLTDNALRVSEFYTSMLITGSKKATTSLPQPTGNKVSTKPKRSGNKVTKVETKVPPVETKFPEVETQLSNNRGDNNNDNNNDNNKITKTLANKSPEHEEISKLYYDAIKTNHLPVLNHTVIKAKIKQMTTEADFDIIKGYLIFITTVYPIIELPYKPQLNNALDIYNKRVQIQNAIHLAKKQQDKDNSRTLHL